MDNLIDNFRQCLQVAFEMPKTEKNAEIVASIAQKFGDLLKQTLKPEQYQYQLGVVTYYQNGYGFVWANDKYYFIHRTNISSSNKRPYLFPGEKVKFMVGASVSNVDRIGNPIVEQAMNLTAIDGNMLKCDKKLLKKQMIKNSVSRIPKLTEQELSIMYYMETGMNFCSLSAKKKSKFANFKNKEVVDEMRNMLK